MVVNGVEVIRIRVVKEPNNEVLFEMNLNIHDVFFAVMELYCTEEEGVEESWMDFVYKIDGSRVYHNQTPFEVGMLNGTYTMVMRPREQNEPLDG